MDASNVIYIIFIYLITHTHIDNINCRFHSAIVKKPQKLLISGELLGTLNIWTYLLSICSAKEKDARALTGLYTEKIIMWKGRELKHWSIYHCSPHVYVPAACFELMLYIIHWYVVTIYVTLDHIVNMDSFQHVLLLISLYELNK